jgi:hypothetical protein
MRARMGTSRSVQAQQLQVTATLAGSDVEAIRKLFSTLLCAPEGPRGGC